MLCLSRCIIVYIQKKPKLCWGCLEPLSNNRYNLDLCKQWKDHCSKTWFKARVARVAKEKRAWEHTFRICCPNANAKAGEDPTLHITLQLHPSSDHSTSKGTTNEVPISKFTS